MGLDDKERTVSTGYSAFEEHSAHQNREWRITSNCSCPISLFCPFFGSPTAINFSVVRHDGRSDQLNRPSIGTVYIQRRLPRCFDAPQLRSLNLIKQRPLRSDEKVYLIWSLLKTMSSLSSYSPEHKNLPQTTDLPRRADHTKGNTLLNFEANFLALKFNRSLFAGIVT